MVNSLQKLSHAGQSVWLDYLSRSLIESGELNSLINDYMVKGVTTNPSIFEKAIGKSTDYDNALISLQKKGVIATIEAYENLVIQDIKEACDHLRSIYEHTGGVDGYASLEVSPHLAFNAQETIQEAKRLFHLVDRPNVMIKVPGTKQGIEAVRVLIGEGINVNVTLLFSLQAYKDAAHAYVLGLHDRAQRGLPVNNIESVASFFISRIDSKIDSKLEQVPDSKREQAQALMGKAAIANAQMAYRAFLDIYQADLAKNLLKIGAHPQRLLWASTSTKNPRYSDTLYVDSLIADQTVNTLPLETLKAFKDHGVVHGSFAASIDNAPSIMAQLASLGINFDQCCEELLDEGIKLFTNAYDQLMNAVAVKMVPDN